MMFVAWPSTFGPSTLEHHAETPSSDDRDDHGALGAQAAEQPLGRRPEVSSPSRPACRMPPNGPPPPPGRGERAGGRGLRPRCRWVRVGAHRCLLDRELALRRSRRIPARSRAVRSWVPSADDRARARARRSGRRRGWCETRCATTMPVASANVPVERGAQARIRRRVQRRERVVEDVDLGRFTRALAIASRCRWPPDTFVPPCAIGASSPLGHGLDEVARLGDLERGPELLVRGVRLAVAQVRRDRAARTGTDAAARAPIARPEGLGIELAHVDAVDQHRAVGDVEQPRQQVDQRGLAGAGAADDRGRLAGLGGERSRPVSTGWSAPG